VISEDISLSKNGGYAIIAEERKATAKVGRYEGAIG